MNETVVYKNSLNKYNFGALTETEIKIAFTLFAKLKDQNENEIKLTARDVKDLINYHSTASSSYYAKAVFKAFDNLQKASITMLSPTNDKEIIRFVLFQELIINIETKEIRIKASPHLIPYINKFETNFTKFELAEFVNLSGKYAPTLYRLLKQFRSSNYAIFKIEDFKNRMDFAPSLSTAEVMRFTKKAIKELQKEQDLFDTKRIPYPKLAVEALKQKGQGQKIVALKFTFNPDLTCHKVNKEEALTRHKETAKTPIQVAEGYAKA